MKHRIAIDVGAVAPSDQNPARNSVEDLWMSAHQNGWAPDLEFLARNSSDTWTFGFAVPARQSAVALKMVRAAVREHFMEDRVTISHIKKVSRE
jgi:hypothetical protein